MEKAAVLVLSTLFAASMAAMAYAASEHLAQIREQCGVKLGYSAAGCDCIAGKAAELTDRQQAMIAAMVAQDVSAGSKIQSELTMEELAETGKFMASVPMTCSSR